MHRTRAHRPVVSAIIGVAALGAALIAGACEATTPGAAALPEDPPADFGVAVTVFTTPEDGAGAGVPARFIVEPDGALRASTGAGAGEQTYPPIVRHLGADHRRQVWWLTLDTGAYDPASPSRVGSPETFDAEGQGPTALVTATVWGSRRSAAFGLTDPDGAAARRLVNELAALSWVESAAWTGERAGSYESAQVGAEPGP